MKNTSLLINVILGIAVIILYILHFSQSTTKEVNKKEVKSDSLTKKTEEPKIAQDTTQENRILRIAYVNIDSLDAKYQFSINARITRESQGKQIQATLDAKLSNLQKEMSSANQNLQTMTPAQVQAKQEEFAKKQQEIYTYKQSEETRMIKQDQEFMKKLLEEISSFMKRYAEENGYDYILTHSLAGSSTLYGHPTLDITNDVIKGLNEEYNSKK